MSWLVDLSESLTLIPSNGAVDNQHTLTQCICAQTDFLWSARRVMGIGLNCCSVHTYSIFIVRCYHVYKVFGFVQQSPENQLWLWLNYVTPKNMQLFEAGRKLSSQSCFPPCLAETQKTKIFKNYFTKSNRASRYSFELKLRNKIIKHSGFSSNANNLYSRIRAGLIICICLNKATISPPTI